jgi:hypothetical protein
MKGLASRWIGVHAAAFALASLVQSLCRRGLYVLAETYDWLFMGVLGVGVGIAYGLRSARSGLLMLLAVWAGGVAGLGAARGLERIFFPGLSLEGICYLQTWAALARAFSEGVLVSCAPAASWKLRILRGGAWALVRSVPALLVWLQGYPLRDSLEVEWVEKGREALLQGGCGLLFGACTLAEAKAPAA